jgi:hypothetical protein
MRSIINILVVITFALSLAAFTSACGSKGDDASCEKVVEHTQSLIPEEYKNQGDSKEDMIAKCEKQPKENRKCALDAKSMEDLMGCSTKGAKGGK